MLRLILAPARLIARLTLAARYWMALDYTWRLSWIKAERR